MTGKRLRNWLQNGVLVLLCALTLLQLAQLPLLQNIRLSSNRLFSQSDGGEVQAESAPLSAMFPAVNLMATVDSEHGRCGQLCLSADSAALQAVIPLFKEAIGSATETGQVADETFRAALNYPGLFLELTSGPLPLEVVAAWLGETAAFSREVRAMALTTGEDDVTSLYLLDGEGRIFRYGTALYPPAVRSVCEGFLANGGVFSYETGYVALAPYTVLAQEVAAPAVLSSERPAGYSAYNLLSALGFNAHTFSRYTESGGWWSGGSGGIPENPAHCPGWDGDPNKPGDRGVQSLSDLQPGPARGACHRVAAGDGPHGGHWGFPAVFTGGGGDGIRLCPTLPLPGGRGAGVLRGRRRCAVCGVPERGGKQLHIPLPGLRAAGGGASAPAAYRHGPGYCCRLPGCCAVHRICG